MGTFSIIPTGYLIDLFANWREMLIGFISHRLSFLHINRAIRLTMAPNSYNALSKLMVLITQGVEKLLIS